VVTDERVNKPKVTPKNPPSDSQVGRVRMEYMVVHETLSDFEQVVRTAWENKVSLALIALLVAPERCGPLQNSLYGSPIFDLRQKPDSRLHLLQNDRVLQGNQDFRPMLTALTLLSAPFPLFGCCHMEAGPPCLENRRRTGQIPDSERNALQF
jgi:hypothetical protein